MDRRLLAGKVIGGLWSDRECWIAIDATGFETVTRWFLAGTVGVSALRLQHSLFCNKEASILKLAVGKHHQTHWEAWNHQSCCSDLGVSYDQVGCLKTDSNNQNVPLRIALLLRCGIMPQLSPSIVNRTAKLLQWPDETPVAFLSLQFGLALLIHFLLNS